MTSNTELAPLLELLFLMFATLMCVGWVWRQANGKVLLVDN